MAIIRYPGSKEKLRKDLFRFFPSEMIHSIWAGTAAWEYREPFFGSGAIGLKVLGQLPPRSPVWLNDIDADLVCMWQAVQATPNELCRLVRAFKPSVDLFFEYKESDGRDDCSPAERGVRKLALHRMSYSGFGSKSGSPLGGKKQGSSKYSVDCRWNAERICLDVQKVHREFRKFHNLRFTCGDFMPLVETATATTFIYLDPPYFEKGDQLYKHPMDDGDHVRLAMRLHVTPATWVLSYDDHPRIRDLYSWAQFHDLFITYTNARARGERPKNREVAITRVSA